MTRAPHVGELLKNFGIRAAELQLGAEFGGGEVIRTARIQSEKPVRKAGVDIGNSNFGRTGPLFGDPARARLCLDSMLNEILRSIRMRFGNAGEFVGPFEHAILRRAGPQKKGVENIERKRGNTLRPARCAGRCDRHSRNPRGSSSINERSREIRRTFKNIL